MNITGGFRVETYYLDKGTGALYKTSTLLNNLILQHGGNEGVLGLFDMYFDASRTWTGIFFVV